MGNDFSIIIEEIEKICGTVNINIKKIPHYSIEVITPTDTPEFRKVLCEVETTLNQKLPQTVFDIIVTIDESHKY
jgi:hypothetical protein